MKNSVFFCENCGKPVPLDAKRCPHCGSLFTAVQCPQCSFVGDAELFSAGCPQCGFLAGSPPEGPRDIMAPEHEGGRGSRPGGAPDSDDRVAPRRRYRKPARQLPGWVYTVSSLVLLAVVIALLVVLLRLT